MSAVRPRLSVDVGTLRTSAALDTGDGTPVLVDLGGHGGAASSTVALADGQVVIGDAADVVMAAHPERGVRELQRRFGDTTPVVLDGQPYTADALTAELLRTVARTAGVQPADSTVVLTHPAGWHEYKCELLAATGAAAGFADVEVISEAEAAVRPYVQAGRLQRGNTVAVYDLGGTFEVSLMAVTDDGLQSVGTPQTLERLGGDVLDQVVFRHVTDALGGTLQQLDRSDPAVRAAIASLRSECTAAKERLSSDGETSIPVVAPGLDTRVRMTRDEFEMAVRPHVNETLMALDRVLASAGLQAADLTAVVLVGGGSRVPVVAEMVAGHLGRPALVDDPRTAVALGAVLHPLAAGVSAVAVAAAAVAPGAAALLPEPIPTSSSTSSSTASDQRETPMSDQPAPENAAPAAGAPGAGASAGGAGRSIPTPPPPPAKRVSSKAKGVAGGLAAAAAAITAAVFYGDDVVDAFDGPDGGADAAGIATAAGAETRTADRAERDAGGTDAAGTDSMDAFDTAAVADTLSAADVPQGAAVGTPLSPPAPQQQSFDRPAPQRQHQQQQQQQRQSSDDDGPDPSPVRQPPAAAAASGAAAGAAAASTAAAAGAAATGPAVDSDFEASRAQLLARLDRFEAPEGTSPEDAAALKAELRDTIERFDPQPGQSADDALADLRDEFDETVQDFTQDQRIDALIAETERDNTADDADDTTAPDPVLPPTDDTTDDDATDDDATDEDDGTQGPVGDANNDGIPDDVTQGPVGDANNDGIPDDVTQGPVGDANGDGVVDEFDGPGEVTGDPVVDPGTIRIDPNLLEEPPTFDPTVLDDGVAPQIRDGVELNDDDSTATGRDDDGTDTGEQPGPIMDVDVQLTGAQLADVQLTDQRPGAAALLDDGFEQLTATDARDGLAPEAEDPDAGGEVTGGFVGDVAVPQVRATVMPGTDLPTMTMTDLGDETYQQVVGGVPDDSIAPVVDAPVVVPEPLDLTIDATAAPIEFEVAVVIPEPEPVELDIQPINPPEDIDLDDGPGLAEDLHNDITPNAPDNLNFGG